jgi:PPP family 3-phenylpropionic acid transporter
MRYSACAALLASAGLWWDGGVNWLFGVLLFMFIHTSAMMPMSEAAMAHLVTQDGVFNARRYGRIRLWGSVGFLVTVIVAGVFFERAGMHHFPAWTVATMLAVTISVFCLPDLKEAIPAHALRVNVMPVLRQRAVQWFFASVFLHVLSHIGIYVFFSLYLDSLGYSKSMIGLLWALSVVVEIGWFFTQSRWLPRMSLPAWLVLCSVAMVLRMGLTASSAQVLVLLLLAQALHSLTFATHHTVCIALLSQHFSGGLRGRGQALYTVIGYGFPGVIGGLAGGMLSTHYGLASVYWASMVISALAVACALGAWRHHHAPALPA